MRQNCQHIVRATRWQGGQWPSMLGNDAGHRMRASRFPAVAGRHGEGSRGLQPTERRAGRPRRVATEETATFADGASVAPRRLFMRSLSPWAKAHGYRQFIAPRWLGSETRHFRWLTVVHDGYELVHAGILTFWCQQVTAYLAGASVVFFWRGTGVCFSTWLAMAHSVRRWGLAR